MPSSTLNSPFQHSDFEGTLGRAFEFAGPEVLQQLAEQWDPVVGGLLVRVGDVGGTGSDTLRRRWSGGYGGQLDMTTMATETQTISASPVTGGYDDLVVAQHGLAFEQSFFRAITQNDGVTLDFLATTVVGSVFRKIMQLLCTQIATFSTNVADANANLDVDDWINLVANLEETEGFQGEAVSLLHPKQWTHLKAALRTEAGYVFPAETTEFQRLRRQGGFKREILGIPVYTSARVNLTGGDYYGGAWVPGHCGFGTGDTSRIPIPAGANAQYVSEYGVAMFRSDEENSSRSRLDAYMFGGVGTIDTSVAPAFLIRSDAA